LPSIIRISTNQSTSAGTALPLPNAPFVARVGSRRPRLRIALAPSCILRQALPRDFFQRPAISFPHCCDWIKLCQRWDLMLHSLRLKMS
jgi:hypothetical protein